MKHIFKMAPLTLSLVLWGLSPETALLAQAVQVDGQLGKLR